MDGLAPVFVHDIGGSASAINAAVVGTTEPTFTALWQAQVDALAKHCFKTGLLGVEEFRRHIESLPDATYRSYSYYGRWAASITQALLARKSISESDLEEALYGPSVAQEQRFRVGDRVVVKSLELRGLFRRPHTRTPGYLFGKTGVVDSVLQKELEPEKLSWGADAKRCAPQPLYRVRFRMGDLWEHAESPDDTVDVEVYQQWLLDEKDVPEADRRAVQKHLSHHQHHHHDHDHHHHGAGEDHGHVHTDRTETERVAIEREFAQASATEEALADALVGLCIKNGIITPQLLLDYQRQRDEASDNPRGTLVVAHAWKDAAFRQKLLADANAAIEEKFDITLDCRMIVHANTPNVHNLVVCTLCSCYPTALLGRPPAWYKSRNFRGRACIFPRAVLSDMGFPVAENVKIRVHDSTSDVRYLVLPECPVEDVEKYTVEQLRSMVNRDHLVGMGAPKK